MTVKTAAQILAEITTLFADNTIGAITPAALRAVVNDMVNSTSFLILNPTTVTHAASPYTVLAADSVLLIDTSGGTVEIDLPASATRGGISLAIKDTTGNAASNNITIKPNGGETIDGYTNGSPLAIKANYGGFRLYSITGGYAIAP